MIREHDPVVLLEDLPEHRLVAGNVGTVVYLYDNRPAAEVEFPNPQDHPRYLVVTVMLSQLLKLQSRLLAPVSRT
jgi:hypothetical protein